MKILIAILFTLGTIGFIGYSIYIYNYKYELVIGSYIENAYEVNTPERMIAEISKAIKGMETENLKPEDYGAFFFKKPDNKMEWQYDFLDSIIERANAVIEWREKIEKSTEVETLGDVYEQKMDNLREFLKENGRADWIASSAWVIKNHPIVYFWYVWLFPLAIITFFSWFLVSEV